MIQIRDGGGNIQSENTISVRRTLAVGDVTASLCVVDKLEERGFKVSYQSDPNMFPILRRHGGLSAVSAPTGFCHVNLDGIYENHPQRRTRHFADLFLESANLQTRSRGIDLGSPLNCTPTLKVAPVVREAQRKAFEKYPKPWVFICPKSQTFFARTIPDYIWREAAKLIHGTKFWIGMDAGPEGIVDLHARHLDNVIDWLSIADMLVTVDTGPMHLAAAVGIPVVAILQASSPELHLTDQRDFIVIHPPNLDCLNCQKDACPINYYTPPCQNIPPEMIAESVNKRLQAKYGNEVSAVISVYRPEPDTLNRCLDAVVPQVSEVVVCRDLFGTFPKEARQHPKIRYVVKNQRDIGYGRKQNYAARHTSGKHLLFMNDDVFLSPNSVQLMVQEMKPGVGMVANLLRYPDGTIYHAGKTRTPGQKGWGHLDYKHHEPTHKQPVEMENVCGACNLVRREANYDIGGFDEDFFVYAEDDDYSLRLRRNKWKIMFTPHSTGIHLEHQSTEKTANIMELVSRANTIFNRKWGAWLDRNLYTVPGTFP